MNVLDELRDRVKWYLSAGEEDHFSRNINDLFDAFEAAHPGLKDDRSGPCTCFCGAIYWRGDVLPVCPACGKGATP